MGKAGRFACILTPMVLSLISLSLIVVVCLGGTNKNDSNLRSIYYAKADMSKFNANITVGEFTTSDVSAYLKALGIKDADQELTKALLSAATSKQIDDVYYIYPWNYCSGNIGTNSTKNGTESLTCSPRKAQYWFNPIEVWGLNGTLAQKYVPKGIDGALNAYKKGAQWMFIAYAVAFGTTIASIVVGAFAICSRIGSCATTFVSSAATLFTFLAALTSTVLFSILVGAMNTALKPYNVHLEIGQKMLTLDWLAVAFSIGATLFWTVSICCCSGRSSRSHKDRSSKHSDTGFGNVPGFGSKGYQPLGEQHGTPYGAPAASRGVEMQDFGHSSGPYKGRETAYEPFRHV